MPVSGFHGEGWSTRSSAATAPPARSLRPPFRLDRKYLHFLVGGGNHPDETCVNLLVDGKARAHGLHIGQSAAANISKQTAWDVGEFAGQEGVIEIVDRHTGGWGHVNADHFVLSDKPLAGWQLNPQRELVASAALPAPAHQERQSQTQDDRQRRRPPQRTFDIELADGRCPTGGPFSIWATGKARSSPSAVDRLREGSPALAAIKQSDELPGAGELYREALRPQFHFSARRGWLNDPNGLVYHHGDYHLFFQHNPYGWNWGNMHWGHATSPDLVHWTEQPIAIYPDELGTAFSGSAVVDEQQHRRLANRRAPPLVCIYTAAGEEFTQCLSL